MGKSVAAASADLLEWWLDEMRESRTALDSATGDSALQEYLRFIEQQRQLDSPEECES